VIHISEIEVLFGGIRPSKPPVPTGLVTNSRLFRTLYYQTMPGET